MKQRRRLFYISVGISALLLIKPASAVIPVVDNAQLLQWTNQIKMEGEALVTQAKQWATQQLQWIEQVKQYTMQGQQYIQEIELYNNFFHNPTLASAMGLVGRTGIGLGSSLPLNTYALMGLVNGFHNNGGGLGFGKIDGLLNNLSALSNQAWTTSHVYSPTDGSWESTQVLARADSIAGAQGAAAAANTDLVAHAQVLPALRQDMLNAQDTKTVLDASAQAQVETAWTVNELAQMTAVKIAYDAQRDSLVQRDDEKLSKDIETMLATSPAYNTIPTNIAQAH